MLLSLMALQYETKQMNFISQFELLPLKFHFLHLPIQNIYRPIARAHHDYAIHEAIGLLEQIPDSCKTCPYFHQGQNNLSKYPPLIRVIILSRSLYISKLSTLSEDSSSEDYRCLPI